VVRNHWVENKKRYGLTVLAFIGLLIAWFVFTLFVSDDGGPMAKDVQNPSYFLPLFVAGTLYASQYFHDLGSRPKGINFVMLPASAFEKMLCALLYTALLFFTVFTISFYLVDSLMVAIANTLPEQSDKATVVNVFKTKVIQFNDGSALNFVLVFFSIQAAFLFGSVNFRKYSYLKTIISGFVLFLIVMSLLYLFFRPYLYIEQGLTSIPWVRQLFRVVMYTIAPLLWIMTYFRLKAKQV
jgi:hypothetical protein